MKSIFIKFIVVVGGVALLSTSGITIGIPDVKECFASPMVATQNNLESILSSYYSGQSSSAFKMLQKNIFAKMISHWVEADIATDIVNPKWNYDSFARYQILDTNMVSASDKELYYCTFSSDNDKYGYIVLVYDGSSLGKIAVVETSYLYDLRMDIYEITDKLGETEFDLSSAIASRIQLIGNDKNSHEGILFTDNNANKYIYYLDSHEIMKLEP